MSRRLGKWRKTKGGLLVRSGLELIVAEQLEQSGIDFGYETEELGWDEYLPRVFCGKCDTKGCYQSRKYTPDFTLGSGIRIEVKGRLTAHDRKVLNGVRQSNPGIDLRLVFGPDNKLFRTSKTRYSEWATRNGFTYSMKGEVPKKWLRDGS